MYEYSQFLAEIFKTGKKICCVECPEWNLTHLWSLTRLFQRFCMQLTQLIVAD